MIKKKFVKISDVFKNLKKKEGMAFIPYITAGYPDIDMLPATIEALGKSGADIIEIGIPFSDPVADGPVLQEAGHISIEGGCGAKMVFDTIESSFITFSGAVIIMTYMNIVNSMGIESFIERCSSCGISGLIIADMPYEESTRVKQLRDELKLKKKVEIISFVSPQTDGERLDKIVNEAEGFIYLISSYGTTGTRNEFSDELKSKIKDIKNIREIPVCVGFGISSRQHVNMMKDMGADGVIVGSAIMKRMLKLSSTLTEISEYVKDLKGDV